MCPGFFFCLSLDSSALNTACIFLTLICVSCFFVNLTMNMPYWISNPTSFALCQPLLQTSIIMAGLAKAIKNVSVIDVQLQFKTHRNIFNFCDRQPDHYDFGQ